jgi:O-antigen/teichoic acid export membrane protein
VRNPLPPGAVALGGGVGVLGLSGYVFLAVCARALPVASFSSLSVLWVLFNVVGPGLLSPVELEVSRAVADRKARGLGTQAVLRRATVVTAVLLLALLLVTVAAQPVVLGTLFDGASALLGALVFSYFGVCCAYLSRGALAGSRRFGRYSVQLGIEGALRMAACGALVSLGVHTAGPYGLVLGAAMLLSVLATLPPRRDHDEPGPPAPWSELSGAFAWLMLTSLFSQVLINSGPVLVKLLANGPEAEAAGPLLAAIVLARVPLFLFTSVQAVLLPRMATLLGQGQQAQFVHGLRRLLLAVAGLGGAGTIAMLAAGPQLLSLAFGARFVLGTRFLTVLAAASGFYMLAMIFNHALIALRCYRSVAAGWASGVICLLLTAVALPGVVSQAVYGYFIGSIVAAVSLGLLLLRALRHKTTTSTPYILAAPRL